jgi:2-C-methyl-D-erythritol 2,4-cyclodiphosphate synthase
MKISMVSGKDMIRPEYRIGTGYDVHRFASGRKLMLGGIEIPFDRGLDGHSDADVLIHAVCDAILGALCLGDIGEHFSDTDPSYKGISSLVLLEKCAALAKAKGYIINNLDCIILAEQPKFSPFKRRIANQMAEVLKIEPELINIKATTTEKLGFTGREEGIAAQVALILRADHSLYG